MNTLAGKKQNSLIWCWGQHVLSQSHLANLAGFSSHSTRSFERLVQGLYQITNSSTEHSSQWELLDHLTHLPTVKQRKPTHQIHPIPLYSTLFIHTITILQLVLAGSRKHWMKEGHPAYCLEKRNFACQQADYTLVGIHMSLVCNAMTKIYC